MASKARRAGIAVLLAVGALAAIVIAGLSDALEERQATALTAVGGARVEQVLGPRDFERFTKFISADFGVAPDGAVVFLADRGLRVADPRRAPIVDDIQLAASAPDSFALDVDGTMLTVANGYFGMLDQNGELLRSIPLPYGTARLAPSVHEGAAYMFGGGPDSYRLYRFIDDGTLQILLDSELPIVAAADSEESVYAATPWTIVRVSNDTAAVVFSLREGDPAGPIRSIAATEDGLVLFSTDNKVFALLGGNTALSIVNDAGGAIRVRNGKLYLLDPYRRLLASVSPASKALLEGSHE